jgi:hypothetical protein
MKHEAGSFQILLFVLATLPLMFAQGVKTQPSPGLPSNILAPQLIAWSQLQRPQPVPQPGQTQVAPPEQQLSLRTFVGMIVKDGAQYVLKVSNKNVYQLDDQQRASQYEGKQVRIAGTLYEHHNILHVTSIELVSSLWLRA